MPLLTGMLAAVVGAAWVSRWRQPQLTTLTAGAVAAALGIAALSEIPNTFAGFLVGDRLLTASVHTDSVQHMAMANMLVGYGRISLGLHGVVPQAYHAFSHLLYGSISRGIGLPIADVYGHATLLIFAPLLFAWLAGAASALVPRGSQAKPWHLALAVLVCVAGFLGHDWFQSCTVWYSYLLSESQLVGLVLFLAFMAWMFSNRPTSPWITAAWLAVMTASKVSVGVMALAAYGAVVLARRIRAPGSVRALLIDFAAPVVATMAAAWVVMPVGNTAAWDFLVFGDKYFGQACTVPIGTPGSSAWFVAYHFFFAWLALGLTWLAKSPDDRSQRRDVMVVLGVLILAGFVPLSNDIPGGSAAYFSNVTTIFAIAVTAARLTAGTARGILPPDARGAATLLVAALGVIGLVCFFPAQARRTIAGLASPAGDSASTTSGVTPYVRELQRLATAAPRDALVYIDKAEHAFWTITPDCTRAAVLIPALSERPALFGLPDAACAQRIGRDYQPYADVGVAASAEHIPTTVLCAETRRLGFARVFAVTAERASEILCPE
ncbi:MAG TPA: hypothetical protein VNJ02_04925 [Vicinamibacterales bacterium]|nr:hypothetical protein [Vicinamibacterales bacterium]